MVSQALLKALAPPVVIALIWLYPVVMAFRGIPSLANNSAKELTLLLLEVTLPNIATTLVQVLGNTDCAIYRWHDEARLHM